MRIGDHVTYKGETCGIIFIYKNGYFELKKPYFHQIVLAHPSELMVFGEETGRCS
ncbi:hypothetical protein BpJC7_06940 [Weizmannia acidilactici]|uniref:Uncharacterized protein n=1 Tax=Weizmannia acidilactici TaxID=2607726 RepID=A0A5J4JC92_9BACI|nr:hypothetical protein [Weizmannia acidilactici]GER66463.1 hypothetical protein BpJC4_09340 [Weizmannia acidilactici]GER69391.1 hypothetical protein BpJC7_06940 [Weizmannia acidilactici]GER72281.1 hypothetical protein BpPP18_03480 [Weizmannia acidilactici]